jgi:hypothetical protein
MDTSRWPAIDHLTMGASRGPCQLASAGPGNRRVGPQAEASRKAHRSPANHPARLGGCKMSAHLEHHLGLPALRIRSAAVSGWIAVRRTAIVRAACTEPRDSVRPAHRTDWCSKRPLPSKRAAAHPRSRRERRASDHCGRLSRSNGLYRPCTSMRMRQWSLGPQASTAFWAVTVTRSAIDREANTKSSCRVAPAGPCCSVW